MEVVDDSNLFWSHIMGCYRSLTVLVIDLELWARELALTYSALAAGHATRDSAIDISAFPGPHRRAKQRRLSNSCPMNFLKWRLAKVELNFGKKIGLHSQSPQPISQHKQSFRRSAGDQE